MRYSGTTRSLAVAARFVFGFAAALSVYAQQFGADELRISSGAYRPREDASFRAEARLVETTVVVRGRRGDTVGGLTRDDFRILDDGHERNITPSAFSFQLSAKPA